MSAEKKFAEDCLTAINEYRSNHQVEPLSYNQEIELIAKSWVDHMAQNDVFDHNPNRSYKGRNLGENIASQPSTTGSELAEQWYSEIQNYNFEANRGRGTTVTGHFTQVVWKDSKEFGIARSQTKDGTWMIVAYFFPPGNFNDDYANNVFPPKDGKIPTLTKKEDKQWTDSKQPAKAFSSSTQVKKSTVNGVTTTYTTETTTDENGVTKVKVTEKIERPGTSPEVKVTLTTTNPDGSKSEETLTEEEKNSKQPAKVVSRSNQEKTSTVNGVTTRSTTETTTDEDGVTKVKVTEKVERPGTSPEVKVTLTTTHPDGSTSEKTLTEEEKSTPTKTLSPSTNNKTPTDNDFCRDVVNKHNKFRQNHRDTEDLILNDKLTALAQSWADHLAQTKSLQHSQMTYEGRPLGESIASKHGTGHVDYTAEEVVSHWYKEIEEYDYANPSDSHSENETGHFTQVVWKNSKEIGVGKAFSGDNRVYVVALYYPAGNYVGRKNYEMNVQPLKHE